MVMASKDDAEPGLFRVFAMWVAPEARGHGLGRGLLTAIEAWMISSGATQAQLAVTTEAAVAQRLYESAGYAPDGTVEESPHTPGLVHVSLRKPLGG